MMIDQMDARRQPGLLNPVVRCVLLASVGFATWSVTRGEFQNDQIGFDPAHVLASTADGETIDVMSGNLNLVIPLGPRYQLHQDFGYQLQLSYNSKIWRHECRNVQPWEECAGTLVPPDTYGIGFMPWFGRVFRETDDKPYILRYQTPDGAQRFFCDVNAYLSQSPPVTVEPACEDGSSTDDKTFDTGKFGVLRAAGSGWDVYPQDGTKVELRNCNGSECYATRIESRTAPSQGVNISYVPGDFRKIQQISDSHGRTITFHYQGNAILIQFPGYPGPNPPASGPFTYTLRTTTMTLDDPSSEAFQSDPPPVENVRVLTAIEYPGLNAATESYRFAYDRDPKKWGYLLRRTLPTGAVFDYHYSNYTHGPYLASTGELTLKVLTLGTQQHRWSYTRFGADVVRGVSDLSWYRLYGDGFTGSNPYEVRVLDPFDNLTVYYFHWSGSVPCPQECPSVWSDGLLERVLTYAGPAPDANRLVKRVQYTWVHDGMFQIRKSKVTPPNPSSFSAPIRPRVSEIEEFTPGKGIHPGSTLRRVHSDWTDLSEFVGAKRTDEYIDGALYRTTYMDRIGTRGQHRFAETRDRFGAVLSRVDRKFSFTRLDCELRRASTTGNTPIADCSALPLQTGDTATVHAYEPGTGQLASTTTLGGDDLVQRTRTHTHVGGVLASTTSAGLAWKLVDRSIDAATGRILESRDPAGNAVRYTWDALGRLKSIEPTLPEVPTTIDYLNARETRVRQSRTGGDFIETTHLYDELGRLIQTKRRNLQGDLDVQDTEYDVAGRVTRKSEWHVATAEPQTVAWTRYDYTIAVESNPIPGRPSTYPDPLGRIHAVTTPDDPTPETPTVETVYEGLATIVTVRDIRGHDGIGETPLASTTTYLNDALGRLVAVDAPGTGADAEYRYDERDNLVEVRLTDPAAPAQVQIRRFVYNSLRRLESVTNPENGTVEYTGHDAEGNLLSFRDAQGNTFKLNYDAAGRVLTKKQTIAGVDHTLVQNAYDSATGRLTQQDSYQIRLDTNQPQIVSTAKFGYGGPNASAPCALGARGYSGLNGRPSWQSISIRPWNQDVRTEFCQDELGLPYLTAYPDIAASGRTRSRVGHSYLNGYLWEMHDLGRNLQYIESVTYGPGGAVTEIMRGDNTRDVIELDERGRPSRFLVFTRQIPSRPPLTSVSGCGGTNSNHSVYLSTDGCGFDAGGDPTDTVHWDSGEYRFDMAGNVTGIGANEYFYDPLSRLVRAEVVGPTATYGETFAFDAFGGMTATNRAVLSGAGSGVARTYGVQWQTNRLTSMQCTGPGCAPSTNYQFDANGNMTLAGPQAFVFDAAGRLRKINHADEGVRGVYDYDANGFRVRAEADGVVTYYIRDAAGQVLSEFSKRASDSSSPAWNKDYVYASGKVFALIKNEMPTAPSSLWASEVSASGLTLHWTAAPESDLLGFWLDRTISPEVELDEFEPPYLAATAREWTDALPDGIDASHTVTYTLMSMDMAGNLSESSVQLAVRPDGATPPAVPTGLVATSGDRAIQLRWNPVNGGGLLAGYIVERCVGVCLVGGGFSALVVLDNPSVLQSEYLNAGLVNGQPYTYRVRSLSTAGNASSPSAPVTATPADMVPPARPSDVWAVPGRPARSVEIHWKSGADTDVSSYRVYRDALPPAGAIADVPAVSGQEGYTFLDSGAPEGAEHTYRVTAIDTSSRESAPSDPVSVRPRHSLPQVPVLQSCDFEVNFGSTTPDTDCPFGVATCCEISAESDDVIQVTVTWTPTSDASQGYRIYRLTPGDDRFREVGVVPSGTSSFNDTTVTGADYTYFVVGLRSLGSTVEESAASLPASGGADRAFDPFPANAKVRNLMLVDSFNRFGTKNERSRSATLKWSRVTEPELLGYNLYRQCDFSICGEYYQGYSTEHFACEPTWMRLNLAPVGKEQQLYEDRSLGGLRGCYLYLVRPVGPDLTEGEASPLVLAYLGWTSESPNHCRKAAFFTPDEPSHETTSAALATELATINGAIRGSGPSTGPPPSPQGVTVTFHKKDQMWGDSRDTRYAKIGWSMDNRPHDLAGYYVEAAGSPDGPWQRLSSNLVAWWEDHYTAQGLGVHRHAQGTATQPSAFSGNTQCLSFRVIAVDELGNVSEPAYAAGNPTVTDCPRTPDAPQGLTIGQLDSSPLTLRLTWDPVPGAASYFVYRFRVSRIFAPYFYDTQNQTGTTFDQVTTSDWQQSSSVNADCPYRQSVNGSFVPDCAIQGLEAYYVTAQAAPGQGESPRSNIVFWDHSVTPPGYVKLSPAREEDPWVALADAGAFGPFCPAALDAGFSEGSLLQAQEPELALAIPAAEHRADLAIADRPVQATLSRPPALQVVPALTLGSLADPPWALFDLHTDHLGSVRVVTGVTGVGGPLVSRHDYFPFGEEIAPTWSYNTHQFTGHERDRESGMDYMLARYYGSSLSRFQSPDPSGGNPRDPQSWNRYAYVRNNPVNLIDPLGLYWAPGTPMPIIPGDPNGCTRCFKVDPAGPSDEEKQKAKDVEQDLWEFYQANQAQLEEVYGAWGVSPQKLEKWFQPGKGKRIKLKHDLRIGGDKVDGWAFPLLAMRVDADLDENSTTGTVLHELTHKVQFGHGVTPKGAFETTPLALHLAVEATNLHSRPGRAEFLAYWVEALLMGAIY